MFQNLCSLCDIFNLILHHPALLEILIFPVSVQFEKTGEANIVESYLIAILKYLILSTYFRKIYIL